MATVQQNNHVKMSLSMIWAMDKNRLIGKGLRLPWHLPNDLKYFKKITMGRTVIMGHSTFKSIGHPLSGRRNIVLTSKKIEIPGCEIVASVQNAIDKVQNDAFVIGGASVYIQLLPFVDKLYITFIDYEFSGDIYFPEFDLTKWKLIKEKKGIKDKKNLYDYWFRIYEKTI